MHGGTIKRANMGKKTDKLLRDKAGANNEDDSKSAALISVDRTSLTPEDYQCTGNLDLDFTELCNRVGYTEIPKVVTRLRVPTTPAPEKTTNEEAVTMSEKSSLAALSHIQEKFSYFKPSIQAELESEDGKSVREIAIRGWKIDDSMLGIFSKCLPALPNLHVISLWNVGLTNATFASFLDILPHCANVKVVKLDGNPLAQQSYYKLIRDDLLLAHLSLRNNKINDEGARLISEALQSLKMTNKNLISLNLSFNHIADPGARYIAEALRLNRSLLTLNLSNNQIRDDGAEALAEVLGHLSLTHKEIVERRRLLMEKESQEQPRSPALSRHGESKSDRPQSHQSNTVIEKPDKSQVLKPSKSALKKKDKEPQKKEDRFVGSSSSMPSQTGLAKKEDLKTAKKQISNIEQKNVRGKAAKSATKRAPLAEVEVEATEITNPLLGKAEYRDGKVFIRGNQVLICLNLLRNRITELGLRGFLAAVEIQLQETKPITGTKCYTGLLRLCLEKNDFPPDNATFVRIQELMVPRDPMHKSPRSSINEVHVLGQGTSLPRQDPEHQYERGPQGV
ncbi:leucine-rich repeat-containing protein 71 isoform X2 [Ascaphus truei]|uniref:leucine-rich repeat-containing protein 71 isoform X2 n=1 Tax=Ascaphus truei TaxID=8439 RepID=UPI003F5A043F